MSVEKLDEYFSALEDPRCHGKVEHWLVDILVISMCAVIACAESWDDIALYGCNKLSWLRSFRAGRPIRAKTYGKSSAFWSNFSFNLRTPMIGHQKLNSAATLREIMAGM
jgi:DDE_Tnp_1-associated